MPPAPADAGARVSPVSLGVMGATFERCGGYQLFGEDLEVLLRLHRHSGAARRRRGHEARLHEARG